MHKVVNIANFVYYGKIRLSTRRPPNSTDQHLIRFYLNVWRPVHTEREREKIKEIGYERSKKKFQTRKKFFAFTFAFTR